MEHQEGDSLGVLYSPEESGKCLLFCSLRIRFFFEQQSERDAAEAAAHAADLNAR